jgi:hypothetical protein
MADELDIKQGGVGEQVRRHGERIRVRRKRKSGLKRGAKLNLVQILIALLAGVAVAAYIVNQNHESSSPPPSASLKKQIHA